MRTRAQRTCLKAALIDRRSFGGYDYIGFRDIVADAPERSIIVDGSAPKHLHALLRVNFNTCGVALHATAIAGGKHGFKPIRSKRIYPDNSRDRGVWYFIGDLPVDHSKEYFSAEWMHIAWAKVKAADDLF